MTTDDDTTKATPDATPPAPVTPPAPEAAPAVPPPPAPEPVAAPVPAAEPPAAPDATFAAPVAGAPAAAAPATDAAAPAGWYDDGSGRQRYWDGTVWTEHYAPAATAVKKRKIWPFVVGGAALLLVLIIVAVVVIVNVVGSATAGPAQAVRDYNTAWWEADCEGYEATTAESFRAAFSDDDGNPYSCETFEAQAHVYYDGSTALRIVVTDTSVSGDTATVDAVETGTSADGTEFENDWTYELEKVGGDWVIDTETLTNG